MTLPSLPSAQSETPSSQSGTGPLTPARLQLLQAAAIGLLRHGLVFLLLLFGTFKFFAFEAEAIRPLIEDSPFMSWLYRLFSVRTASALIGAFEVGIGLLIAARRWLPRLSGLASLAAAGMFLATLSFLGTTPGALEPTSPIGGFLMKDLMLLGAALFTASEALLAAGAPRPEGRTAAA
jgi:reactive chlorine resistance protein C